MQLLRDTAADVWLHKLEVCLRAPFKGQDSSRVRIELLLWSTLRLYLVFDVAFPRRSSCP